MHRKLRKNECTRSCADDLIVFLVLIWRLTRLLPVYGLFGRATGCFTDMLESAWISSKALKDAEKIWWNKLP